MRHTQVDGTDGWCHSGNSQRFPCCAAGKRSPHLPQNRSKSVAWCSAPCIPHGKFLRIAPADKRRGAPFYDSRQIPTNPSRPAPESGGPVPRRAKQGGRGRQKNGRQKKSARMQEPINRPSSSPILLVLDQRASRTRTSSRRKIHQSALLEGRSSLLMAPRPRRLLPKNLLSCV